VQTHGDDFRHFVPMGDVKAYCANNIEPTNCEADNIGIAALADALAEPTDHQGMPLQNAHMLRLLYRPWVSLFYVCRTLWHSTVATMISSTRLKMSHGRSSSNLFLLRHLCRSL
jgi:hypothetical protein